MYDLDTCLMPPPSRLLKPGTDEYETGELLGLVESSLPLLPPPVVESSSDAAYMMDPTNKAAATAVAPESSSSSSFTEEESSSSFGQEAAPTSAAATAAAESFNNPLLSFESSNPMVSPVPRTPPPPPPPQGVIVSMSVSSSTATESAMNPYHHHHQVLAQHSQHSEEDDSNAAGGASMSLTDQSPQQHQYPPGVPPADESSQQEVERYTGRSTHQQADDQQQLQQQEEQQQQDEPLDQVDDGPASPPPMPQGERKRKRAVSTDLAQQELPLDVTFEKTRLRDIVGHGAAKLRIDELLLPLALPRSITDSILTGVRAQPASILFYGPPGCGKTLLARALAGEAQAAFLSISPGDILSKFVGESEAAVRSVFKRAEDYACQVESKCAVIFFDEIDALGQSRENNNNRGGGGTEGAGEGAGGEGRSRTLLAELLVQLSHVAQRNKERGSGQTTSDSSSDEEDATAANHADGQGDDRSVDSRATYAGESHPPQVLIIAATNRPDDCDPALLRRFGVRIHVGLPSKRDRAKLLRRHLNDFEHAITDADLLGIAEATEGWSPCDLESLAREAAMAPVRECVRAAALQKKRQRRTQRRRLQQTEGDICGPEEGGDQEVRNSLLASFQSLRPVTTDDFERAAAFYLGQQDQQSSSSSSPGGGGAQNNNGNNGKVYGPLTNNKPRQPHYDSSSDEDGM